MTILDNSAVSKEADIAVINPWLYIADPDSGKPLELASLYFGLTGRDGEIPSNRKRVYLIQDNGISIPIEQPVKTGAGGVPMYNGSPAQLAVDGSFSLKILDSDGQQRYYTKKVAAKNLLGYSGVIAEETRIVSAGAIAPFEKIEATTATLYASELSVGNAFNGRKMALGVDYIAISESSVSLETAYADGTIIKAYALDPTGQTVAVGSNKPFYVFDTKELAKAGNLKLGDAVRVMGGVYAGDGLGGDYLVVALGTGTDDGENYISTNNSLQLELASFNSKMSRYVDTVSDASIVGGVLTIDLNKGSSHKVTLTDNITSIQFSNVNNGSNLSSKVELKIVQNAADAKTVSFTGIRWAGGTAPTMSSDLGSFDRYVFITDNGVNWDGHVAGQNYS